jgi:hypothetical protein
MGHVKPGSGLANHHASWKTIPKLTGSRQYYALSNANLQQLFLPIFNAMLYRIVICKT